MTPGAVATVSGEGLVPRADLPGRAGRDAPHEWFAGLTVDHLYADCPSRMRAEETLRWCDWWDVNGARGIDPYGSDVCGMCLHRYERKTPQ